MYLLQNKFQDYFLYAYFFLINYEAFDPLGSGGSFSISKLMGILYLISIFTSPRIFTKLHIHTLKYVWPKVILIFWITLVSLINFNETSTRFYELAVILNLFIFLSIINHSLRRHDLLDKCLFFFVIGSISVSVLFFLNIGVSEDASGRAQFFNSELNELSIKLAASLLIIISYFLNDNLKLGKIRYILLIFIPFLLLAISRSGSRTAFLLLVMVILFLVLLWAIHSRYKIFAYFASLSFSFIVVAGLFFTINTLQESSVLLERLALTGTEVDSSEGARFFLWAGFVSIIFNYNENLFFGNGLSGFDKLCYDFFGFVESPHNVFLEVIIYTGIFGLILYFLFVSKIFFTAVYLYKHNKDFLAVTLIPVALTFIFALQGMSEKICWLIFAYIISKSIVYNNNKSLANASNNLSSTKS